MDDLDVLARDFGYRPQGKSVPMRSDASDRRNSSTVRSSSSSPFVDDRDGLLFNDVFGGPPKYSHTTPTTTTNKSSSANDFDYDSIFKTSASSNLNSNENYSNSNSTKTSSLPVYDKPVYDDDIFEGLPGLKSKTVSSNMRFEENIFASMASPPKQSRSDNGDQFDDLLGNLSGKARQSPEVKDVRSSSMGGFDDLLGALGRNEKVAEAKSSGRSFSSQGGGGGGFDDLLGGFGSGSSASGNRSSPRPAKSNQTTSSVIDDPFVVLGSSSTPPSSASGVFTDPLEEISKLGKSENKKADASSVGGGGVFDDLDPLNGLGKPVPPFSTEKVSIEKEGSPSRPGPTISGVQTSAGTEHAEKSSFRYSDSQQKFPSDNFHESPLFDMPSVSMDSKRPFDQNASSPPYESTGLSEKNFQTDMSPRSEEQAESVDDIWLTVSEIPLYTQPTKAPPPSRPPPPVPRRPSKAESGFFSLNARKKGDDFSPSYGSHAESPKFGRAEGKSPLVASQIDELEDFVSGRSRSSFDKNANFHSSEEMDAAAAAMKEAMDRAEAKFRHAKEVREREYAKAARSKENLQMEENEEAMQDTRERDFRENQEALEREQRQREKEEEERGQRRLERERARQAEIEREKARQAEIERERARQAEIERERARQAEIERERARQAVERATREARERAAAGARERAVAEARQRAERAAVEKAQAEARERAERMAVQRAQAEARERAAAEARERANAEAREKEAKEKAEARRRAERAAVEKAAAEARERAAAEARERAAAAAAASARVNQQKNENDLESFFSTRASSAPKARASSSDPFFDSQFQSKGGSDATSRTSFTSVPSSNIRKASSTTNIVDDLSSIFGAPPSSGEFQEVEGESEERRKARLERHQRTQERAARALAEKNQRDLQAQREQEERHRIAESLDFEIKRWAAGKEGNLRALLSTLQYVLWPECGWQPVSLTDLITGASVKKVYRKATLCIHPDKVQQKGATLQQKYIAEKVFDLLKEAWNKFNSEELF